MPNSITYVFFFFTFFVQSIYLMFLLAIIYACTHVYSFSLVAAQFNIYMNGFFLYILVNIYYKWAKRLEHHIKSMWVDEVDRQINMLISFAADIYCLFMFLSLSNNKAELNGWEWDRAAKVEWQASLSYHITWTCGVSMI